MLIGSQSYLRVLVGELGVRYDPQEYPVKLMSIQVIFMMPFFDLY